MGSPPRPSLPSTIPFSISSPTAGLSLYSPFASSSPAFTRGTLGYRAHTSLSTFLSSRIRISCLRQGQFDLKQVLQKHAKCVLSAPLRRPLVAATSPDASRDRLPATCLPSKPHPTHSTLYAPLLACSIQITDHRDHDTSSDIRTQRFLRRRCVIFHPASRSSVLETIVLPISPVAPESAHNILIDTHSAIANSDLRVNLGSSNNHTSLIIHSISFPSLSTGHRAFVRRPISYPACRSKFERFHVATLSLATNFPYRARVFPSAWPAFSISKPKESASVSAYPCRSQSAADRPVPSNPRRSRSRCCILPAFALARTAHYPLIHLQARSCALPRLCCACRVASHLCSSLPTARFSISNP